MNPNIIREVETLYSLNQNFFSDHGFEKKQESPGLNQPEYRNLFPKDPERYLEKEQLMCIFRAL